MGVDGAFGDEPRALLRCGDARDVPEDAPEVWGRLSKGFGVTGPWKFDVVRGLVDELLGVVAGFHRSVPRRKVVWRDGEGESGPTGMYLRNTYTNSLTHRENSL